MTSKAQAKDDIFVPFSEQQQIDRWLQNENLNRYGDPLDTMYLGGTPLFNEQTGESQDRYQISIQLLGRSEKVCVEIEFLR